MAGLKSLARDTAVYGLSSIVGRFLNWGLVPLYTITFSQAEYGVVTLVYAVVAVALLVLTYGMETGFFRFANHERWSDPMEVYSTALISLAVSSSVFVAVIFCILVPVSRWLECAAHPEFVGMMAVCVALDAFTALPFSYLRYRSKALRFAILRLIGIGVNIGLNLFFILLCPWLMRVAPGSVDWFYNPDFGIGYIFLSNLVASALTLVLLIPELCGFPRRFNGRLWREMIVYSAPLLVLGVAGVMNQTIDKIIFPSLVHDHADAMAQLGIYGANYKIAIIMVMFIQAFRFAYEPFIFSRSRDKGENHIQAFSDAMKYFVLFAILIFLGVMYYLDIIRYFISPRYFSGLRVVPVVMLAEFFFGVFFNLSLWYKLTDRTIWGAWFSLFGLGVTVALNVLLVPRIGYMGCAYAALCSYGAMMVASYFVGRHYYPIPYHLRRIAAYCVAAAALYFVGIYALAPLPRLAAYALRALLLAGYVAAIVRFEKIPIPGLRR
ncbi:MAG: polysaccharide biosynthesis C-terminal domain-containing protein [Muribaculaceae bacterium]|nr:polysaccharide biosynthesis C-terminal domain-containing protein [Muribaculaceae bacterium]